MYKTAESVAIGHPDKVCDQIADAILDSCLKVDPLTRSAVEVLGGHGLIVLSGELATRARIDADQIARDVYKECGYNDPIKVVSNIGEQSLEIKKGVDNHGAGDQGIMVGYATNETKELMPLEVMLSRKLARLLGKRDGKTQVTTKDGKVVSFITSVCGRLDDEEEKRFILSVEDIIRPHLVSHSILENVWVRNPNGEWLIGGFAADTGLTGRKIIVDNYGPNVPVGGGAFSGKDATKVDRSGAYMARKIATEYLKKYDASEVIVRLAYAIGMASPIMAVVDMDGKEEKVSGYDLRPRAIIEYLDLQKSQYRETSRYGHFGNGFSWE
jgi:S-adenosylmethionine synthetase